MTFTHDFEDTWSSTATHQVMGTRDKYGKGALSASPTSLVRCHIINKTRTVRTAAGEDRSSTITVYFPPPGWVTRDAVTTPTVTTTSQLLIASVSRVILSVELVYDEDGVHHQRIFTE